MKIFPVTNNNFLIKASRYGVNFENSRQLIMHFDQVVECLLYAPASNERAEKLLELIQGENKTEIILCCGFIVATWVALISPLHSKVSQNLPFREIAPIIAETKRKFHALLSSNDIFMDLARECDDQISEMSELSYSVLSKVNLLWSSANDDIRNKMNHYARLSLDRCFVKLASDMKFYERANPDPNCHYPMTNRAVESHFSVFKFYQRKYLSMTKKRKCNFVIGKINKVWLFLSDAPECRQIFRSQASSRRALSDQLNTAFSHESSRETDV